MYQIKAHFLTLPKGADTENAYFTMSALPQPLNIPCESALDFSDSQEVTTANTNLLVETTPTFLHDLVKNGKNGALAVCFPMKCSIENQWKKNLSPCFFVFSRTTLCHLNESSTLNNFSRPLHQVNIILLESRIKRFKNQVYYMVRHGETWTLDLWCAGLSPSDFWDVFF